MATPYQLSLIALILPFPTLSPPSLVHSPLLAFPPPGQPQRMAAAMAAPSTGLCFARAHRHLLLPPSPSASKLRVSAGSFSPATTFAAGALGFGRSQLIGFPVIFTTGRPSLWPPHKAPIGPVVARNDCPLPISYSFIWAIRSFRIPNIIDIHKERTNI